MARIKMNPCQLNILADIAISKMGKAYHLPYAFEIKGCYESSLLEECVTSYTRLAHPSCNYSVDVVSKKVLVQSRKLCSLNVVDIPISHLDETISSEIAKEFDLYNAPLARFFLFRLSEKRAVLLCIFHHLILDGITYCDFINRFSEIYKRLACGNNLVEYPQFECCHPVEDDERLVRAGKLWVPELEKLNSGFNFRCRQNLAIQSEGYECSTRLSKQAASRLYGVLKKQKVTLFQFLLSALAITIKSFFNEDDFPVHYAVHNALDIDGRAMACYSHALIMNFDIATSGCELNNVISYVKAHRDKFRSLDQVTITESLRHVEASTLSEKIKDIRLAVLNSPGLVRPFALKLEGLNVKQYPIKSFYPLYDLALVYSETGEADYPLSIGFHYSAKVLRSDVVRSFLANMLGLIRQYISSYQDCSYRLFFNATHSLPVPKLSVIEPLPLAFLVCAKNYKNKIAYIGNECEYSYGELAQLVKKIAAGIRKKTGAEQRPIVVSVPENEMALILPLAIMLSGNIYVPVTSDLPIGRIREIIAQTTPVLVISDDPDHANYLPNCVEVASMLASPREMTFKKPKKNDLAYIMFTSGSTGKPKGVPIYHSSLQEFLTQFCNQLKINSNDRFIAVTSPTFDISLLELMLPMVSGAELYVSSSDERASPVLLNRAIKKYNPSVVQLTPSRCEVLLNYGVDIFTGKTVLLGGEEVKQSLVNQLFPVTSQVWNVYGPTEATIWVALNQMRSVGGIYIGGFLPTVTYLVLDDQLKEVANNAVGELYLAGPCLSPGYWKNDEATTKAFIPVPEHLKYCVKHQQLYKTGDVVRRINAGRVEYIGRSGDFVKVSGYRIDLMEIELLLNAMEDIESSCVVVRNNDKGQSFIAVFYVANNANVTSKILQQKIETHLPSFMIPSAWYELKELPYNTNGKIDRRLLAIAPIEVLIGQGQQSEDQVHEAVLPSTIDDVKDRLYGIIATVLNYKGVIDDNVPLGNYGFESLTFTDLADKLEELFKTSVKPTLFYQYDTIKSLVNYFVGRAPVAVQTRVSVSNEFDVDEENSQQDLTKDIAIIGISGIYPESESLTDLYQKLIAGFNFVGQDQLEKRAHFIERYISRRFSSSKASIIEQFNYFDASFFKLSPREAESLDPRQRLLLMAMQQLIDDAGYPKQKITGTNAGVYIGAAGCDYWSLARDGVEPDGYSLTGNSLSVLSNRISYFYDLHGPSATIDTACSSSLVATVRAIKDLQSGEVDMAVAGGVNLLLDPYLDNALAKNGMLSKGGGCKPFSDDADGYVRGEGVGLVLMKPLTEAVQDNDRIDLIIKGAGESHGGHANNLATPSVNSQIELLETVYKNAKINPNDISYFEAHGTGTTLGDPIEASAIQQVLTHHNQADTSQCLIGSVKSQLGHTEAAAGISGLLKLALAARYDLIAPNINFNSLNKYIDQDFFHVLTNPVSWSNLSKAGGGSLAALSSFGFGGANAHMVVQKPQDRSKKNIQCSQMQWPIPVSAKTLCSLKGFVSRLVAALKKGEYASLADISYTLSVRREHYCVRHAVLVASIDELIDTLEQFLALSDKEKHAHEQFGNKTGDAKTLIASYLNGDVTDFSKFFGQGTFNVLPLPCYVFDLKEYWYYLPDQMTVPNTVNVDINFATCKGLLQADAEHIKQHVVSGQPTLPGVAYILAIQSIVGVPFEIQNISWQRPCLQKDLHNLSVRQLKDEDNVTVKAGVMTENDFVSLSEFTVLTQISSYTVPPDISDLDIGQFKASKQPIFQSQIYKTFASLGLSYGDLFQGVKKLWKGESLALAEIEIDNLAGGDICQFDHAVAGLDSAFQSTIAFFLNGDSPILPFVASQVVVLRHIPLKAYCIVKRKAEQRFDLALMSEKGEVCVFVKDLSVRQGKPNSAVKMQMNTNGSDLMKYYTPRWNLLKKPETTSSGSDQHVLIIYPRHFDDIFLIESLEGQHEGDTVLKLDYSGVVSIDSQLLSILRADIIYFLGGVINETESLSIERAHLLINEGLASLLQILKSADQFGMFNNAFRLSVPVNNTVTFGAENHTNPFSNLLDGFVLTANREFPEADMVLIDFDSNQWRDKHELARKIKSITLSPYTSKILLKSNRVYFQSLTPINIPTYKTSIFKQNAVYLLLGGSGGIGYELSKYLAKTYQAKLIWIGTTELDADKRSKIDTIKEAGGLCRYFQADGGDAEALGGVISEAREVFGDINGVFNLAIRLHDIGVRSMDTAALVKPLKPKVDATISLWQHVASSPIDFFVIFSSIQSFIGNPGQANYGAACTFQDGFVDYLRSQYGVNACVINWGYWGSVGIVSGHSYKQKLEAKGIYSIEPDEGIATIEKILAHHMHQVIAVKTDRKHGDMIWDEQMRINLLTDVLPASLKKFKPMPLCTAAEVLEAYSSNYKKLNQYAVVLLANALLQLGIDKFVKVHASTETIRESLKIHQRYFKLFDYILYTAVKEGLAEKLDGKYLFSIDKCEEYSNKAASYHNELLKVPNVSGLCELLENVLESYPSILVGEVEPMGILFPNGDVSLVSQFYKNNPLADTFNLQVTTITEQLLQFYLENSIDSITIVEIGAGTGSTSEHVLAMLKGYADKIDITYYYTDISRRFIKQGYDNFGEAYPFVTFETLDIDKDLSSQGFVIGQADLVLATNVLHATPDMSTTLWQVKGLLNKHGHILLNELQEVDHFNTFIFGMTSGWWLYDDAPYRIEYSPLLTFDAWRDLLCETQFDEIMLIEDQGVADISARVIFAKSNGYVIEQVKSEREMVEEQKKEETILNNSIRVDNQALINFIKKTFADSLRIKSASIDIDEPHETYGVDSLIALELLVPFKDIFGYLPATLLFECSNIRQLADYFVTEFPEIVKESFGINVPLEVESSVAESVKHSSSHGGREPRSPIQSEDIAIVGLGGQLPYGDGIEGFWDKLKSGISCIREVPASRWNVDAFYEVDAEPHSGKSYSKWGGFIDDVDTFDATFFNLTPRDVEAMDPQERLFIQTAWITLESGGYGKSKIADIENNVGVFVGVMNNDYAWVGVESWAQGITTTADSNYWSIANRVSYLFDFMGPSLAIDTACSASLTAIHYACESLRRGECELALAGGVNLILHPRHLSKLSSLHMLSHSKDNKSFSEGADGFVDGEGVGAVLLKPLSLAIEDGDIIFAVIKSSSVNAGGRTSGYTVPNPNAQAKVIRNTFRKANIDPRTVTYVEAHGTGTKLGDPIEIQGLTKAFATEEKQYCAIGSVKSNIGHLESAAGIAGLIKLVLQLQEKVLVPSINAEVTNPHIKFEKTPFYLQTKLEEWRNAKVDGVTVPLRACISSFGAGGANAHMIVEQAPEQLEQAVAQLTVYPVVFSAKTLKSLKGNIEKINIWLKNNESVSLMDLSYTLCCGREMFSYRAALAVTSIDELRSELDAFINGKASTLMCASSEPEPLSPIFIEIRDYLITQALEVKTDTIAFKQKLMACLDLFVRGGIDDFRWVLTEGKMIYLPGYQFDKEKFWPGGHKILFQKDISLNKSIAPLVDENVSTLSTQMYKKMFRGDEVLVSQHNIGGKLILPAAASIEMVFECAKLARPDAILTGLKNVSFWRPIEVEANKDVHIVLTVKSHDKVVFNVFDALVDKPCVTGAILYGEQREHFLPLEDFLSESRNAHHEFSREKLYEQFRKVGYDYGNHYMLLDWVSYSDTHFIGQLKPKGNKSEFVLNPYILDASLQMLLGKNVIDGTRAELAVPTAIELVEVFAPSRHDKTYYCLFSVGSNDVLSVVAEDGRVIFQIKGVQNQNKEEPSVKPQSRHILATNDLKDS